MCILYRYPELSMILHSSPHRSYPYINRGSRNVCSNRCAILYSSSEARSTVVLICSHTLTSLFTAAGELLHPLTLSSTNNVKLHMQQHSLKCKLEACGRLSPKHYIRRMTKNWRDATQKKAVRRTAVVKSTYC